MLGPFKTTYQIWQESVGYLGQTQITVSTLMVLVVHLCIQCIHKHSANKINLHLDPKTALKKIEGSRVDNSE